MKNFEKKETNLNLLIDKLAKLNTSYSQYSFDNKSIEKERDLLNKGRRFVRKSRQLCAAAWGAVWATDRAILDSRLPHIFLVCIPKIAFKGFGSLGLDSRT